MKRSPKRRKAGSPVLRERQRISDLELEERDRPGYLKHPQKDEEVRIWADIAAWLEWPDTI